MPSEAHFMKKIQDPHVIKLYQYLPLEEFYIYIIQTRSATSSAQETPDRKEDSTMDCMIAARAQPGH